MYQPIENEIFHVHTWRCGHAGEEQDYEYVEKAIELGASRIVFTDHCPYPGNPFLYRMDMEQLDDYVTSMKQLKREYGKKIEVLAGLEAEYLPAYQDYYKELKASGDFDLLLLGQHMYEHEDGSYSFSELDKTREFAGLCHAMVVGMATGLFDVIAHPDRAFRGCREWNQEMLYDAYEVIYAANKKQLYLEKNYSSMRNEYQYWEPFWVCAGMSKTLYGYDAHSVAVMELFWKEAHFEGLTQAEINHLLGGK